MRKSFIFYFLLISSETASAQTLEVESGVRTGTQISTQRAGYSGSGYVTGFDADGDKVAVTVHANKGVYNIYVRYASPSGDKFNFVFINDQNLGSVAFPATTSFKETKVGKVFLNKGANTIAIVKEWGYFDVDNIRLELSEPSVFDVVAMELVTPVPSFEADSLYDFLVRVYGKVILSGQYGGASEFNRIKNVSAKTPVIRGFDMMDYSPSRIAFGATSTEAEKAIDWNRERGIVTFCWHWNAPKDLINQPGKEWWRGFYTEATTFDVTQAMNDPSGEAYQLIIRDIDAIAIQLKKLKDANVPVLWRPLHEAEGKWFWWGAKGPEACKWLWKLVFDRLVTHHQLNNLIWVWTSTGNQDALSWYPGDEYVDMIGADIYLPSGDHSSSFITFDNLAALYGGKKIITLSENGPIPDPESLFGQRAAWSWFATWGGNFILDGISNSTTHINKVFNHEYVITLDEIDNIDAIVEQLEKKREDIDDEDDITGIAETHTLFSFQNPVINNRLVIQTQSAPFITKVDVYNTQGKLEFTEQYAGSNIQEVEIDLAGKSQGIYLVRVSRGTSVKILRVVKY
jgi:mannan endo-1,4-beta-mannosidase